ncbi:MAG TPA: tetratricopeptide repeat protein [Ktedonobacteraceae bacterium]|nr:tetratricopeptide repeat protein [Ktedonobacteraceae bacterium]
MDTFTQAVELKNQRKYQEALPLIQQTVTDDPTSHFAWTILSEILLETNHPVDALRAADKAIALDAGYAPAWTMKGRALAKIDRPEEGIAACQKAIACDGNFIMAYLEMGVILNNLERHDEALDAYNQALMINSTHLRLLLKKCETLIALHRVQEAVPLADRMLRLAPNNADSWFAHAHVLVNLEQFRKAEEAINRCIAIEGPTSNGLLLKALIVGTQNRLGEARALSKQAADLDPSNQFALETHDLASDALNKKRINTGVKAGKFTLGIIGAFFEAVFRP